MSESNSCRKCISPIGNIIPVEFLEKLICFFDISCQKIRSLMEIITFYGIIIFKLKVNISPAR